jgi:hypothetical protein
MNLAKRVLMLVGFVVLVAGLVSVLAPKATHALVATLVQVANTTANPVNSVDADRATRIPYQSSSSFGGTATGCYVGPFLCPFNSFTPVPAGYRLVIQNVSAQLVVGSGKPVPFGFVNSSGGQIVSFVGTYAEDNFAVINQQITSYHNAGDTPYLIITADWYGLSSATVTLSGYLENCSVTGCPPVQN